MTTPQPCNSVEFSLADESTTGNWTISHPIYTREVSGPDSLTLTPSLPLVVSPPNTFYATIMNKLTLFSFFFSLYPDRMVCMTLMIIQELDAVKVIHRPAEGFSDWLARSAVKTARYVCDSASARGQCCIFRSYLSQVRTKIKANICLPSPKSDSDGPTILLPSTSIKQSPPLSPHQHPPRTVPPL